MFHPSVLLLTIKISQSARENSLSYCKNWILPKIRNYERTSEIENFDVRNEQTKLIIRCFFVNIWSSFHLEKKKKVEKRAFYLKLA